MKHATASVLLTLTLVAVPVIAQAQRPIAYTSSDVQLRAGPGADYPVVALLPTGFQLLVQGCLPDYSWCDVLGAPSRGWVDGADLSYPYQGTSVPVLQYGHALGIGVMGFVLNDYWTDHYRGRPWYRERHRWMDRPHHWHGPVRPLHAPRELRPQHPRLPQEAAPIGPWPRAPVPAVGPQAPALHPLPGLVTRPPRDPQAQERWRERREERGGHQRGEGQRGGGPREGGGGGERQQR